MRLTEEELADLERRKWYCEEDVQRLIDECRALRAERDELTRELNQTIDALHDYQAKRCSSCYAEGRAAALEEAAKVVEAFDLGLVAPRVAADAIRALKDPK